MTLMHRVPRSLKENRAFYLAATVLTVVALLLFYLANIAGVAVIAFTDDFFERNQLESAHFTTYMPLDEDAIAGYERDYDLLLEPQHYVNIETNGVTARVFEHTNKVDRYEITAGRDVEANGELVISEGYAQANNVALGDTIAIADKNYEVVGYMQRPDYLYMLENEDDSYKNTHTFFLCYVSDDDFDALGATTVQYLVRYGDTTDTQAFRKAVNEKAVMRSYSASSDNARISVLVEAGHLVLIMSYVILFTVPLLTVALVGIITSRKVKNEQRLVGTLSAMGYTNGQLMRHYAAFAVLPGVVGAILATVITYFGKQTLVDFTLMDYEPVHVTPHMDLSMMLLGLVVPTAMYALAAMNSVRRLLKKDTVLLLNGTAAAGNPARHLLVGRRISFKVKLALRTLLAHPARSFVVFLGVFLGSLVMLWGLGMRDTMVHASTTSALELGSFEHEYLLNTFLDENPYGGEELLVSSLEAPDGTSLLLVGAASDSIYLNLALVDGADAANATDAATAATAATAALEDGYYVTSLAAEAQGWQVGDRLTFYNPLTLEACELTVAGVINNNAQKAIFTSPELVEELTGLAATRFNALVSATALDIPSSLVAQEVKTQAIGEQINVMIEEMDAIVGLIVGLGMIVCVAAVCVAVDLLVAESRSNISMLKVLGYRDRSIDAMVLNAYHLLVPVGIVLAIPAARAITEWQMWVYVDYGVMFMKPTLTAASLAVTIALVVACYASSLLLLRRKVARVNMIEALKDQRE